MSLASKTLAYFIIAAILLYAGFHYLLSEEQRKLFFSVPLQTHLISMLFVIPTYFFNGIELRLLYSRISKVKLSVYDTLTLPFVINLWGFIFPFQGSFFYTVGYIFSKYKKSITDSAKIYLISFSISMSFAGMIGIFYWVFSDLNFPGIFLGLCILLLINPVLLYFTGVLFSHFSSGNLKWLKIFFERAIKLLSLTGIDKSLVFYLIVLKIINVLLTALWSYWIVISLNIPLSFLQLILISLLMNLTILIKITPGNLGLNQFASGGIALLVGGTLHDGFLLSAFQYFTIIILAVSIGGLFSFQNFEYFSWQTFKSLIAQKRDDRMKG